MNDISENPQKFLYYYKLDFKFINHYKAEFPADLDLKLADNLEIYLRGTHIATFDTALKNERMRSYKITFCPGFISFIPEDHKEVNFWQGACTEVVIEKDYSYSVFVGPELLHYWFNKLIWEAAAVICYKSHH